MLRLFHRKRSRHLRLYYPVSRSSRGRNHVYLNDFKSAAAVGTVQVRSLIEPLRKIVARLHGHYIAGKAVDLVMGERLVEVETLGVDGTKREVYIP